MVEERDDPAADGAAATGNDGGDTLAAARQGPAAALREEAGEPEGDRPAAIVETRDVTVRYGDDIAVDDVSVAFPEHRISAIIGPSGCGKSTLLRALNRMNDFIPVATLEGRILFKGEDVYAEGVDPVELRRRIGMVFQKPNPFPKSIWDNVAWGPKIHGLSTDLDAVVEESLRKAALWDEVKDKLDDSGLALSGGQQQRLCIARAIAMEPEVILMDEPASALDPIATAKIEDLLFDLRERYTIIIVTHNMQQAARVSDYTAFLYQGRLIEFGPTDRLFTNPREQRTEDYITGKFG